MYKVYFEHKENDDKHSLTVFPASGRAYFDIDIAQIAWERLSKALTGVDFGDYKVRVALIANGRELFGE